MRLVFMGTPDFAEASLRALLEAGYDVAAAFTQPDRPRDRGMRLAPSPVKALAESCGIPVYQPVTFRDGAATKLLRSLEPELLVVVAYGRLLPADFLTTPRLGGINVHASLLPKYRGAAPIQWAVLNGERVTGVTVQRMAPAMDAGDILAARETPIGEFETSGQLFDRLKTLGAGLLTETVAALAAGTARAVPQDESQATYTKMLDKSLSPIDWTRAPREIVKHICGLDPWPAATLEWNGETLRVFGAAYTENTTDRAPGTVLSAGKQGIEFACGGGGTLLITELQPAGKKRMSSAAYLLGHPLSRHE